MQSAAWDGPDRRLDAAELRHERRVRPVGTTDQRSPAGPRLAVAGRPAPAEVRALGRAVGRHDEGAVEVHRGPWANHIDPERLLDQPAGLTRHGLVDFNVA